MADTALLPGVFSTGMLSPVRADSSTEPLPLVTVPSTGMRPPCRTITVSPALIWPVATVTSVPLRRTTATSGASASSAVMAPVVLPLERSSRYLPTVTRARIMPADSKYRSGMPVTCPAASRPISMRLYTSPAAAPSATSESMLGLPLNRREKPTVK